MRWALLALSLILVFSHNAAAQEDAASFNANLDIVENPICFSIKNEADYTMLGSFITDYFIRPQDGIKTRHRSNFRLSPDQSEEFCTYGPFLPNRMLTLTLRTLFPVFECNTRVDYGEIVIKGARRSDDNGVITWAECFRADGSKTSKPAEN